MKKLIVCLICLFLTGCGASPDTAFKVGVTPGYQADIAKEVQQLAAQQGFSFEIIEIEDYVGLNTALKQNKIDLNCFQHQVYLDRVNTERQTDFVAVGKTFLAPAGLYSATYPSLEALPPGATLTLPDDLLTTARCLWLLEKANLITLTAKPSGLPALGDLAANPRGLKLLAVDSSRIRQHYPTADAVFLTQNYALSINLTPDKAMLKETADSPFTQLIVARADHKNDPRVQKFLAIYHSPAIKTFIQNTWPGKLLPGW